MRIPFIGSITALLLASSLLAQIPTWWQSRGVTTPNPVPDDHAAINQGQLKNLARATFDEMQATLPGGAGTTLSILINSWQTPTASTDDFLPVNQGQLKALASAFYQRLEAVRGSLAADWPVIHFPWAHPGQPAPGPADPLALANIGQAKQLFAQLDGNRHTHGNLSVPSANPTDYKFGIAWLKDSTGSGHPDYQAIELDTTLLVYDFLLVSGGGQTAAPNAISAEPIIVKLLHQNAPAANVVVTLDTGGSAATTGTLSTSASGPWQSAIALPTNTQGQVRVWWQAPNQASQQVSLTASTLGATTPLSIAVGTGSGGGGGTGQPPVVPIIQPEWRVKWMIPMSQFFDASGYDSWAEIYNFFGSHHWIDHPENQPADYYGQFISSGSYSSPTTTPFSNWRFIDYLHQAGAEGWFRVNWSYLQGYGWLMENPRDITIAPGPRCNETSFVPTTNNLGHVTGWTCLPEIEWQQVRFRLASPGNQALQKTWLVVRHDEWKQGALPIGQIDPHEASLGPVALQSQVGIAGALKVKVSAGAGVPQLQLDRVNNPQQPTSATELFIDPETDVLTLQPQITPNLNAAQYKSARFSLMPMDVNCPELYMFSGHTGDKVELCKVSGIACEWKLKTATPAIGTFDHPTDTACSFTATTKGKNTIQLVVGGDVVWEKPTEVIEIVTRAGWGAVAPKAHTQTMPGFQHVTLHHTSNTNTGAAEVKSIQTFHMRSTWFLGKGFDDIGYHFIMDKAGVVYEGRQLEAAPGMPGGPYTKGEHVGANNTVAGIGFCTMGDYEGTEAWPAARQKDLEKAVSALCRRYKIAVSKISYHKTLSLSTPPSKCPGSNYIPSIPDIVRHVTENLQ